MGTLGLSGKVAVVTGAAQGIGSEIVRSMVMNGVLVAALDINEQKLMEMVRYLKSHHFSIEGYKVDVSNRANVVRVIEEIENHLGPIDILVNVAGVLRTGSVISSIDNEDWETVFAVNSTGVFNVSSSVSKRMVPRKKGSIITIASNAASVPRMNMSAYCASKAAAVQFTKTLALELAKYQIRCNVVSPGSTNTEMQRQLWNGNSNEKTVIEGELETYRIGIPLSKLAEPSDIAEAVLFLASDRAKHITMQNLYLDGGASLGH